MALPQQYWEQRLIERLNETHEFVTRSRDLSARVASNNTLNFASIGARPAVVEDHDFGSAALTKAARTDTPTAVALIRLDTAPTPIIEADAHGLPYDVNEATIMDHAEELRRHMARRALHAWAPAIDGVATTHVRPTTGAAVNGRLAMTFADFIQMKADFDKAGVPQTGRVAVLQPDHFAQLYAQNATFFNQFIDNQTGQVARIAGFDVYVSNETPLYFADTAASDIITKKAFGAAAAPTTDLPASIFYHESRVIRAIGEVKVAMDLAENRPEDKTSIFSAAAYIGFAAPSNDAIGAVYSPVGS